MQISRKDVEKMTENAALKPVKRMKLRDFDLLISDGFLLQPHIYRNFRRFGIEPDDFRNGGYITMWWLMKDERMFCGNALFCDVHHNPELDLPSKQQARITSAFKDARDFLKRLESHGTEHRTVH